MSSAASRLAPARIAVRQPQRACQGARHAAGATTDDASKAVAAAKAAAPGWRELSFDDRAAILLKAAELLSGPWRARLNAATMLGQSKTAYQAEIDSACELIDFWASTSISLGQILEQPAATPRASGTAPTTGRWRFRLRDHAVQLHRDRGNLPTAWR